jgi:hypothetical protein
VFSKPILSSALSKPALQHQFIKWLVKASVIEDKVVNTSKNNKRKMSEINATDDEQPSFKKGKTEDVDFSPMKAASQDAIDATTEDDEVCASIKDSIKEAEPIANEIESEVMDDGSDDLLGSILNQMGDVKPKKIATRKIVRKEQLSQSEVKTESTDAESAAKSARINDLLGDILGEMGGGDATTSMDIKPSSDFVPGFKKRYSIVNFSSDYVMKQRILIRTSNHGIDQNGEKVCLTVKSDYLPAIGAEVCF